MDTISTVSDLRTFIAYVRSGVIPAGKKFWLSIPAQVPHGKGVMMVIIASWKPKDRLEFLGLFVEPLYTKSGRVLLSEPCYGNTSLACIDRPVEIPFKLIGTDGLSEAEAQIIMTVAENAVPFIPRLAFP